MAVEVLAQRALNRALLARQGLLAFVLPDASRRSVRFVPDV